MQKKKVLLKLTGELFLDKENQTVTSMHIDSIITQIKNMQKNYQFGIVIGGGNFFRGKIQGDALGLYPSISHQIGMLSTMMNGLIIYDRCTKQNVQSTIFCAIASPEIGTLITPQTIADALKHETLPIFTGGTGNPFFTTDTAAILRALEMGADEVWKGTTIDGIYTADPAKNRDAKKIEQISYADALEKKLGIMDITAYAMAQEHNMQVRVFDIFTPDALRIAAENPKFGSTIY